MCGRKTLTKGKMDIIREFSINLWEEDFQWEPHYNIAPTMRVPILICGRGREIKGMYWGLIPSWSKDEKIAVKMINARAETLLQRPSFSRLLAKNRCVVISDGYYEWKREGNFKVPFYIRRKDDGFLPMAGLYDVWIDPDRNKKFTYTVITTDAIGKIRDIHNRMQAILERDEVNKWIDWRHYDYNKVVDLLRPNSDNLDFYPVSKLVNDVRNNSLKCIQRVK